MIYEGDGCCRLKKKEKGNPCCNKGSQTATQTAALHILSLARPNLGCKTLLHFHLGAGALSETRAWLLRPLLPFQTERGNTSPCCHRSSLPWKEGDRQTEANLPRLNTNNEASAAIRTRSSGTLGKSSSRRVKSGFTVPYFTPTASGPGGSRRGGELRHTVGIYAATQTAC